MSNIRGLRQNQKLPWAPKYKETLAECLACDKLTGELEKGGFSEREFIASMQKSKIMGFGLSHRQLNTMNKIHRLRVLGIRIEYKKQELKTVKHVGDKAKYK